MTRYQSILNRIKAGFFHIPTRRRRCLETMNTHSTKRYLIILDSSQPPGCGGNYYRFQEWFTHFFCVLSFLFLLYEKIPPIIWVFSRYHQPILCKCGLLLHAWLAKSWKLSLIHLFSRIKIVRRHYKFCLMCFYYFSFFYYREVRYFSGKIFDLRIHRSFCSSDKSTV